VEFERAAAIGRMLRQCELGNLQYGQQEQQELIDELNRYYDDWSRLVDVEMWFWLDAPNPVLTVQPEWRDSEGLGRFPFPMQRFRYIAESEVVWRATLIALAI